MEHQHESLSKHHTKELIGYSLRETPKLQKTLYSITSFRTQFLQGNNQIFQADISQSKEMPPLAPRSSPGHPFESREGQWSGSRSCGARSEPVNHDAQEGRRCQFGPGFLWDVIWAYSMNRAHRTPIGNVLISTKLKWQDTIFSI